MDPETELELATRASEGDSRSALELRRRILRCTIAVARKTRWLDAMDAGEMEDDIPNEVFLRLIARIRHGFDGEGQQFRSYLYRVVTSVAADAVRRNLDRRAAISLDSPFESADGSETTLRDFVENSARIGCMSGFNKGPEETSLSSERSTELASAIARLDPWCRTILREAVVAERPHTDIATEQGVSVQMLDVSLKRCTERLYRGILSAYATGTDRSRKRQIADSAENLPENLRLVFLPWWVHNLSVRQIATDTGLSVEEAKQRLARAKATMWTLVGS